MARNISSNEFSTEVLNQKDLVLVDFYAEWCGPCKMLAPIIEQFSVDIKDKVKVFKVDVDKNSDLSQKYQITAVPTLCLFKDGQVAKRVSGLQSLEQLKRLLD